MILKKKEYILLFFLIFSQSCSGGRIGNFLESSFNDLEKISQDEDASKNLENKKVNKQENQEINYKIDENGQKVEKSKSFLENKKVNKQENQEINYKIDENGQKVEKPKIIFENKQDIDLGKIKKQKNNKIKNSSRKRKIELQSYKIIFILKDVDPKDPTEELSSILSNSEVNFEIEKIERILDSKNKSMNKN